jgi:hypothetical protein
VGLASSAGRDLAARRPVGFVVFGLFGTVGLLLLGIALIMVAIDRLGTRRLGRVARVLSLVVGGVLLLRGIALEILLATNADDLRATIGPLESLWSLALWNPWFIVGGVLFVWTARCARRPTSGRNSASQ